jgi:RHS repeat-associated protein
MSRCDPFYFILAGNTVNISLQDGVIPISVNRPGSAPDSSMTINNQKELTAIANSNGSGISLTREAGSGRIMAKSLPHLATTYTYTYYDNGWLASESRPGLHIAYNYREDGMRNNVVVNGETINFIANAAGQIVGIENQLLGTTLLSPYTVGVGGRFLTIEHALQALYAEHGNSAFTQEKTIWLVDDLYTGSIEISSAVAALNPTAQNRLIIRGRRGSPARLTGTIKIKGIESVTLSGIEVANTNVLKGLVVENAAGTHIQNCIVLSDMLVTNSPLTVVKGNTFNYTNAWGNIKAHDTGSILFQNNIYLNASATPVIQTQGDTTAQGAYNLVWPVNETGIAEEARIHANPLLTASYSIASSLSPAIGSGTNILTLVEDIRGKPRPNPPSRGAYEPGAWEVGGVAETLTWVDGRLAARNVNGKNFSFIYDGRGRLTQYIDSSDPSNSATYEYDAFGRRISITVGGTQVTRCVYRGQDVVAEYIDQNGDGTPERKRIYWLMPEIDQRIGFIDIVGTQTNLFYYLTDQVGSVLQIVSAEGEVVNQYDYDAFGNIRWENSFESIPNRYTFQGREWDAHAGHYYYRNRTYIPELGIFTGPDMNLALGIFGETYGIGNYIFCNNNPLIYTDPLGLAEQLIGIEFDPNTGKVTDKTYHASVNYADPLLLFPDNPDILSPHFVVAVGGNATWSGLIRRVYDLRDARTSARAEEMVARGIMTKKGAMTWRVEQRNDLIRRLRSIDNPVGREYANMLKPLDKLATPEGLLMKGKSPMEIIRTKPNLRADKWGRRLRVAGPTLMILGAVVDIVDVAQAPEEERLRVLLGKGGGYAGAASFASAGGRGGVWLGGFVPHPLGRVVGGGIGLVGGGIIGGMMGEQAGYNAYDAFLDE